jgi:imidazolonepropionase-like amidohydrolase
MYSQTARHKGETMRIVTCLILATLLTITAIADEHTTIVHAGTLLAVPGEPPHNNQSIIIKGTQIAGVEDGFVDLADVSGEVTVIDLSDKFVLPGLMDMHVHLLGELGQTHPGRRVYNGARSRR